MLRFVGTEFVPKADFSETTVSFQTPVGSSLEATEAKAQQVQAIIRELPEVLYTLATINTGSALGKNNTSIYIRLVDRKDRQRNVDEMSGVLRQRLSQVPGITVTHVGLLDSVGGNKQVEFSLQGPDQRELERLALAVMEKVRHVPGLVDLDSSVKANKPTIRIEVMRDSAADLGLGTGQLAAPLRTLVAGHHAFYVDLEQPQLGSRKFNGLLVAIDAQQSCITTVITFAVGAVLVQSCTHVVV